jgi:iron complex outermembrane receptor protein
MSRRRRGALALIAAPIALLVAAAAPGSAAGQQPEIFPLDTVRVTVASRTEAFPARSRMVSVLTADQLRALSVRSVAEALQYVTAADVQPRSPAQADFSLRGSTFEQVVVLVDGVRMSDPQTGHFDLDLTVPLERIDRIEVLHGAGSTQHGSDALGGVVNIVTREGGSAAAGRIERGSFESWRASGSVDLTIAGIALGVSGEWEKSDGHRPATTFAPPAPPRPDPSRLGTDFETSQLHAAVSAPLAAGRLSAQAGLGHRDFGADGFYAPRNSYEETRTAFVAVGWTGEVAGGFTLHPRLSVRRHDDDFTLIRTNPAVYRNVHVSRQRGGELVLRRRPFGGVGMALATGVELFRDDVDSDNLATPAADDALGVRAEDRRAAFAELGWAEERVSANAGLRIDAHEAAGEAWSPSISGSVDVTDALRARASWGRSFRAPSWTERYYRDPVSIGDPDLQPERSWTAELGADLALPGSGVLRVTAFRREAEDLIDWVKPAGSAASVPSTVRNVESAVFDGIELTLEALGVAGLRVDGGLSALSLDSEEAGGLMSRYALRPIQDRATLTVSRPLLGELLLVAGQVVRERRRGEASHTLLGARAQVTLPGGALELWGTNLADESYPDLTTVYTQQPALGRALRIAYRVEVGGP